MSAPDLLHRFVPRPAARLRLVCFPHAGGDAGAYRAWAAELPDDVELVAVRYPGRAERLAEPPADGMTDLVAGIAEALADLTGAPYALFGHSMGAAVAHETALALRAAGRPDPVRLVVSGREAPVHHRPDPAAVADEAAVLAAIARFGGTPAALLDDPEARALILRVLGADLALLNAYRPTADGVLTGVPVSAMIGGTDPQATPAQAADWYAVTTGPFDLTVFPGDHFYLVPHRGAVITVLRELLAPERVGEGNEGVPGVRP